MALLGLAAGLMTGAAGFSPGAFADDWRSSQAGLILGQVRAPTLVIHGAADRLVFPRGGRRTAGAVPKARLRIYEGMAHDLPEQLWPQFAAEIEANAHRQV